MKILLSAYACEPNKGSEPGVGWNWALNLSKDPQKDVYVLTRRNNKKVIDKHWVSHTCPVNLHFFYYDLPSIFIWAKHHGLSVNLYYEWWLIGSAHYAGKLHAKIHFDIAHHLTFGVFRNPCFLYKLQIPYMVGPFGGGEMTPHQLLPLFTRKERLREIIRDIANKLAFLNPFLHKSLNNASLILTKTEETKLLLSKWRGKTHVHLEIGIERISKAETQRDMNTFLYIGRFTYLKGIRLLLYAFKKYAVSHPEAHLLMIGRGDMESEITQFTKENNLNVVIIPWLEQKELYKYYSTACAMVFPSLHDSSGNVVLESLSYGLPVICLDCGGPISVLGENLKELVVSTKRAEIDDIISEIEEKMNILVSNNILYQAIQKKSITRAESLIWEKTVNSSYNLFSNFLNK